MQQKYEIHLLGFNDLFALLLSEEAQMKIDTLSISPYAHIAQHAQFHERNISHKCGCTGATSNANPQISLNVICHNCRGQEHLARQCSFPKIKCPT